MPSQSFFRPVAHRGVTLRGDAAAEWLSRRGSVTPHSSAFALTTDELASHSFRIARIWHTATVSQISQPRGLSRVILQVEGSSVVTSEHWSQGERLEPGGVAVLTGGIAYSLASQGQVARLETDQVLGFVPLPVSEGIAPGLVVHDALPVFRSMLLSVANAALNSRLEPGEGGFPGFQLAVQNLVNATLFQALDVRASGRQARPGELFRRAQQVIAVRASDPTFTVEALAEELRISRRYLHRVFADQGAAPSLELTAERVRLAQAYLEQEGTRSTFTLEDVAQLSGFSAVSTLRRALARARRDGTPRRESRS